MSEVKYGTLTTAVNQNIDLNTGAVIRLNPPIPQGNSKGSRIGNKIRFKFGQFRMTSYVSDGTSGTNPFLAFIRIMIVQMRVLPAAGLVTGPTLSEVLDAGTNNIVAITSSVTNTNVRVLMDKTYMKPVFNNYVVPIPMIKIKKKFSLRNNCSFALNTDTLPTDPKDNYYLLAWGDTAGPNDAFLNTRFSFRLSFIDV